MNLVIAMPLRDKLEPETQYALDHHLDGYKVTIETTHGLPVIEARNTITKRIRDSRPRPDLVVWIDGDGFWLPGTFDRIVTAAHEKEAVVGGWTGPQVEMYRETYAQHADGREILAAELPADRLIPARHVSPAMLAVPTHFLDVIGDNPWTVDPLETLPTDPYEAVISLANYSAFEDASFSRRLRDAGAPIYLDGFAPVWQALKGCLFLPRRCVARLHRGKLYHETTPTIGDRLLREREAHGRAKLYGATFDADFRALFARMIANTDPAVVAEFVSLPTAEDGNMAFAVYCAVKVVDRAGHRVTVNAVAAKLGSTIEAVGPILVRLMRSGRVAVDRGSLIAA